MPEPDRESLRTIYALSEGFITQHPMLHHYTSIEGLDGITRSNSIRATHYAYLNDPKEIFHLNNRLIELFSSELLQVVRKTRQHSSLYRQAIAKAGSAEAFVGEVVNLLFSATFTSVSQLGDVVLAEPYVACFSSHPDSYTRDNGLLSQWNTYSSKQGTRGKVCLVFDTRGFIPLMVREANTYEYSMIPIGCDVIYDHEDARFADECADLLCAFREWGQALIDGRQPESKPLLGPLTYAASRFKSQAFREEQEVRFIFFPVAEKATEARTPFDFSSLKVKPLKNIYPASTTTAPYLYFNDSSHAEKLPLVRVIVGPQPDEVGIASEVRSLLDSNGYASTEVTISETKLRE